VPYLETAIRCSPSELVFPNTDGSMLSVETSLQELLRSALGRAGIVNGYSHTCRRKGCGHTERANDADLRRCPKCNMKLWPRAEIRKIRFHDLRHTTASLLMMAGANPAAVQRILRHSDPRLTTEVYGHLAPDYLRREIDLLSFGKALNEVIELPVPDWKSDRFGTPVVQGPVDAVPAASDASRKGLEFQTLSAARPEGIEPPTLGLEALETSSQGVAAPSNHSQIQAVTEGDLGRGSPGIGPNGPPFGPLVVQGEEAGAGARGDLGPFLDVRELAANAIRVSTDDLRTFLRAQRERSAGGMGSRITGAGSAGPGRRRRWVADRGRRP
jgi:hypothetical protein